MAEMKTVKEPLFHITKRANFPLKKAILIRASAIVLGLLLGAILCSLLLGKNFLKFFEHLFKGAFGTSDRTGILFRDTFLLLGVGLALVPAFKMKFWNLGGNGQILMGCVTTIAFMHYLGGKLPDAVVILFMIVGSVLAGAIWGVIPALFKAWFRTNETLFTLMMNYVAIGICEIAIKSWATTQTGTLSPIEEANIPPLFGNVYLLPIVIVIVLTAFVFAYMKFFKHGYEVSVVGESENTARYVGINVKKVIIRTMILSGAICGLIGLIIGGAIDYTISANLSTVTSSSTFDNIDLGFTAVLVAWLGNLNPLIMVGTSFLVAFMTRGMEQVKTSFGLTESAVANIVIGLVYFFIIGCEFFIRYKLKVRAKKSKEKANNAFLGKETDKEAK